MAWTKHRIASLFTDPKNECFVFVAKVQNYLISSTVDSVNCQQNKNYILCPKKFKQTHYLYCHPPDWF